MCVFRRKKQKSKTPRLKNKWFKFDECWYVELLKIKNKKIKLSI